MAIGLMKLHAALRAANVPESEARAAAEEVAEFKDATGSLREIVADIRSTQRLQTWMIGLNTAGVALLIGKVFALH